MALQLRLLSCIIRGVRFAFFSHFTPCQDRGGLILTSTGALIQGPQPRSPTRPLDPEASPPGGGPLVGFAFGEGQRRAGAARQRPLSAGVTARQGQGPTQTLGRMAVFSAAQGSSSVYRVGVPRSPQPQGLDTSPQPPPPQRPPLARETATGQGPSFSPPSRPASQGGERVGGDGQQGRGEHSATGAPADSHLPPPSAGPQAAAADSPSPLPSKPVSSWRSRYGPGGTEAVEADTGGPALPQMPPDLSQASAAAATVPATPGAGRANPAVAAAEDWPAGPARPGRGGLLPGPLSPSRDPFRPPWNASHSPYTSPQLTKRSGGGGVSFIPPYSVAGPAQPRFQGGAPEQSGPLEAAGRTASAAGPAAGGVRGSWSDFEVVELPRREPPRQSAHAEAVTPAASGATGGVGVGAAPQLLPPEGESSGREAPHAIPGGALPRALPNALPKRTQPRALRGPTNGAVGGRGGGSSSRSPESSQHLMVGRAVRVGRPHSPETRAGEGLPRAGGTSPRVR